MTALKKEEFLNYNVNYLGLENTKNLSNKTRDINGQPVIDNKPLEDYF